MWQMAYCDRHRNCYFNSLSPWRTICNSKCNFIWKFFYPCIMIESYKSTRIIIQSNLDISSSFNWVVYQQVLYPWIINSKYFILLILKCAYLFLLARNSYFSPQKDFYLHIFPSRFAFHGILLTFAFNAMFCL